ncbi:hypothetical protein T11_9351 [Trichinella zimbabwensis]|uniref:Uncharacterized protein n=1 Tax=Trichinella zimbabwensis TaxID=268475 RepID=A0A0V1I526_9BILA|nr:hypothetical protein T11_9351 [Trichinella zimbabwensis]
MLCYPFLKNRIKPKNESFLLPNALLVFTTVVSQKIFYGVAFRASTIFELIQFKLIPDLLVQFEIVATPPICTLLTMAPSLLFVLTFVLLSIFSFILYGVMNAVDAAKLHETLNRAYCFCLKQKKMSLYFQEQPIIQCSKFLAILLAMNLKKVVLCKHISLANV